MPDKQYITVTIALEIFAKILTTHQCDRQNSPESSPDVLPKILADGTYSDIILKAGGREFKAHMCILAGMGLKRDTVSYLLNRRS